MYMFVRQYSSYNPAPWKNEGSYHFAALVAAQNKGIVSGGFSHKTATLQTWTEGHRFGGGSYRLGTFRVIPISYGIPSLSP